MVWLDAKGAGQNFPYGALQSPSQLYFGRAVGDCDTRCRCPCAAVASAAAKEPCLAECAIASNRGIDYLCACSALGGIRRRVGNWCFSHNSVSTRSSGRSRVGLHHLSFDAEMDIKQRLGRCAPLRGSVRWSAGFDARRFSRIQNRKRVDHRRDRQSSPERGGRGGPYCRQSQTTPALIEVNHVGMNERSRRPRCIAFAPRIEIFFDTNLVCYRQQCDALIKLRGPLTAVDLTLGDRVKSWMAPDC